MNKQSPQPAGRAKNALRHGIFASDVILPWEDPAEFDAIVNSVFEALSPHGILLEEAAWDIANILWLKRRVVRGIGIEYRSTPIGRALASSGAHTIEEAHRLLHEQGKDRRSELRELGAEFKKLGTRVRELTKQFEDEEERYGAEREVTQLRKAVVALLTLTAELEDARVDFNLVYNPVNLERMNGVMAQLDARLDKALNRYIGLAERVQFFAQQPMLIEAPGTPTAGAEQAPEQIAPPA